VSENLVGKAQLRVSYVNARQKCSVVAPWKALWTQTRARTSGLQTPWCQCEFKYIEARRRQVPHRGGTPRKRPTQ